MSHRVTEAELAWYKARVHGSPVPVPEKRHKYNARKVTIDGHVFASKWEGRCYTDLKWRVLAGQITEPLLQVRFSIGSHYGRERAYVADFVYMDFVTGMLVVADAKGMETEEYKRKRRAFEEAYEMKIMELRKG